MTAAEMRRSFLLLYDKITNFSAPGYEDDEISLFLTKSQQRLVLQAYNPSGNKYREGFEDSEQRRKDLQELVKVATLPPSVSQVGVLPNGKFFDLPADCLYVITESITVNSASSCYNGERIPVKPITHDEYEANNQNPFKKPYLNGNIGVAWRLDLQNRRHEIITDSSFSVANYFIRYIMFPQPIIIDGSIIDGVTGPQDCKLNDIFHERIVQEAVKIATGVTDPQYYQIQTNEAQEGE